MAVKVFISQVMAGRTDENIYAERERAIEYAKSALGQNIQIIDSFLDEPCPENVNPGLYYLGKSILLIAEADIALFCHGWEHARGCKIEHDCAQRYGIRCLYFME